MSEGELSAAGGFTPSSEVLSSAIGPTGEDIFAGMVSLMEQAEALEQVPCRSTAEVITNLQGRLEQIQTAGCCDCRVSIADVQIALESLQAVPIGQCASLAARLALEISSLPQTPMAPNVPIGQLSPGTPIILPAQPAPVDGEAPPAPVSTYREPKEGEVCPPSDTDAPEPGAIVKIFPECVAQLHALGGPVAEGAMSPAVFWTEEPGERMISKLRPVSDPVMDTIIRSADWAELLGRLAALLPEIP